MTKEKDHNEDKIQSSVESIGTGLFEVIIDQFATDGIVKDIPFAGTILGLVNASRSLKDQLFEKKLRAFLEELEFSSTTAQERNLALQKLKSEEHKIKVGEKLLYILEASEDHIMAGMVGKLFNALIKGDLTYDEFLKASSIINRSNSIQLQEWFETMPFSTRIDNIGDLAFSGLYKIKTPDTSSRAEINQGNEPLVLVRTTSLAEKIIDILDSAEDIQH